MSNDIGYEKKIFCCKECDNPDNIKLPQNEVSKGIWECHKCGHPHSQDEFMEYFVP